MSMQNPNPGTWPVLDTSEEIPRTKQEFEAECNIKNIMQKYRKTGELSHVRESLGQFRDLTEVLDLEGILNISSAAHSSFEELPSAIRDACEHDVAKFLDFVDDPKNREFCESEGLFTEAKTVPKASESLKAPDYVEPKTGVETPKPPDAT